jgi:plasmid maintenance system antidote protein VapI
MDNGEKLIEVREILIKILHERKVSTPSYSLRALAKEMKVHPSHLSRIINQKSRPSAEIAFKLGRFIHLPDQEVLELIQATISSK